MVMAQSHVEFSEIVSLDQAQSAKSASTDPNRPSVRGHLIAQWQLDENSKLYCRWVKAD